MRKIFLALAVSMMASLSFAQGHSTEFALGAQFDQRSGWLAKERNGVGFAFSYHVLPHASLDGVNSFFDIQFGWASYEVVERGGYPFEENERISRSRMAFIPQIGFWKLGAGHFFIGVGPQIVTLEQSSPQPNLQSYGMLLWQGGYRARMIERWSVNFKLSYFDYTSVVNDQSSFFGNMGALLQVGYQLF